MTTDLPLDGGCTCRAVRYRMTHWPKESLERRRVLLGRASK